jgi:Ca-activated chloride channel family protein
VSVTDPRGNFVSGLGQNNFRIFEDRQPRDIKLFEEENTPVSVGLIVDHSGSMASKLPNVLASISGFTRSSNPQDEMFVVDFGDRVRLEHFGTKTFTSNPQEIEKAVSISGAGRTALYDAVATGLDQLQLAHRQRKALVIVSDGGDNASSHKYSQILALARAGEVVVYAVGLVDENGEEENPKILDQLCKDTGGLAFFPRSQSAVIDVMVRIAQDLREQYLLGFVPNLQPSKQTFRKLHVQVIGTQHEKLYVRSRPGYFAGPEGQSR